LPNKGEPERLVGRGGLCYSEGRAAGAAPLRGQYASGFVSEWTLRSPVRQ